MSVENKKTDLLQEVLRDIRAALRVFPLWKDQFNSSERKQAILAFRRFFGYLTSDIAAAAEEAGITAGQMSYQIYQPDHFTPEDWRLLKEVFQLVDENRAEIFHSAHSPSNKKEKLKV